MTLMNRNSWCGRCSHHVGTHPHGWCMELIPCADEVTPCDCQRFVSIAEYERAS